MNRIPIYDGLCGISQYKFSEWLMFAVPALPMFTVSFFIEICHCHIPTVSHYLGTIIPRNWQTLKLELEFIKLNPIAVLLDLRNRYAQSPLKTIDLGPLTKKTNSLNL
jgi:hypothetical protein